MGKSTVTSETLFDINTVVDDKYGKKMQLRVVDWISEDEKGVKHWPQVEKREFFKPEDEGADYWKMGKAKGLNGKDFLALLANWRKIAPLIGLDEQSCVAAFEMSEKGAPQAQRPAARTSEGPASTENYHQKSPPDDDGTNF